MDWDWNGAATWKTFLDGPHFSITPEMGRRYEGTRYMLAELRTQDSGKGAYPRIAAELFARGFAHQEYPRAVLVARADHPSDFRLVWQANGLTTDFEMTKSE